MTPNTILTNFNVPPNTRLSFDRLCQMVGRSRTSVLVELMEDFILNKGPGIRDKNGSLERIASQTNNCPPPRRAPATWSVR